MTSFRQKTTCAVTLDYVKVEQFRSMATYFLRRPEAREILPVGLNTGLA